MNTLVDKLRREPAAVVGAVVAMVALVGVNISQDNVDAVTQLIVIVVPLIGAWTTRAKVVPLAPKGSEIG